LLSLTHRKAATFLADPTTTPDAVAGIGRRARACLSARMVRDLIICGYGCALAALGGLATLLFAEPFDPLAAGLVAAAFVVTCLLASNLDLRELQRFGPPFKKLVAAFACALLVLWLVAWMSRRYPLEAATVGAWFIMGCGALGALHGRVARGLRESALVRELSTRRIAIVCGHEHTCARFLDLLRAERNADIRVIGVFDDAEDRRPSPAAKPRRSLEDLLHHATAGRIDEIFLAFPWHAERRISALVDRLAHLPVDLKLCPDRVGYAQAMEIGEHLAGVPVATLRRQPIRDWGRVAKRTIDVVLSATVLALFAVPMGLIALAVKLDSPGPVLFRQPRRGFDYAVFELLKFRTMRHDPGAPVVLALVGIPGDPRVTRFGRWLRRTSLDELPQLINVLRGEMSLVGPRPNAMAVDTAYVKRVQRYAARQRVKPGITGWAQVNGWRGAVDTEEKMAGRVAHDLDYIENWSLLFDLKIMALTVLTGFGRKNAY
jgi:Undecaprenyl-phosphate glucose phosphotransferase